MKTMKPKLIISAFLAFTLLSSIVNSAGSQAEARRAVDMMLVIDNSCSMFPRDQILPGCQTSGSDPNFLRITGADLFLARLGFADVNETSYNLGVVGLGDAPELLVPLQELASARDTIAQIISQPVPQSATKLIPALEMAYQELADSPSRDGNNLQAVVLLTDGIPWPRENQSNADIEALIDSYPDIPLFVMLLQSGETEFETYNRFWEQMQRVKPHLYVYRIADAGEIEKTYNSIVAKIQDTIPTSGRVVSPDQPYDFYVSEDVQRIIITVVHPPANLDSQIIIQDPDENPVKQDELGVNRFRGQVNPVEVISIFQPRLSDSLKNRTWTITSNTEVNVFLDRQGAYSIQFLSPSVSITDFSDSYLATRQFSSNKSFEFKFNLLYANGTVKSKPEIIRGKLILPDGSENTLTNTGSMNPDSSGVYTAAFDPLIEYPEIGNQPGRFIVVLEAGSADAPSTSSTPITVSRLLVDFSPGTSFATIEPASITCSDDQPAPLKIGLSSIDSAAPGSMNVRVFTSDNEVTLTVDPLDPAKYSGELGPLCKPLVEQTGCGISSTTSFKVRLSSELLSTSQKIAFDETIPVTLVGPECPPSPSPTPTLPPPSNCDGDALVDTQDQCPCQSGFSQFQGCPPPAWLLIFGAVLLIGLIAFVIWLIPSIRILITPPPQAFVLACIHEERFSSVRSTYRIGMERRVNRIRIGGSARTADLVVKGLQPVEFIVAEDNGRVQVFSYDLKTKRTSPRLLITDVPASIPTSVKGTSLKFSLRKDNLEC